MCVHAHVCSRAITLSNIFVDETIIPLIVGLLVYLLSNTLPNTFCYISPRHRPPAHSAGPSVAHAQTHARANVSIYGRSGAAVTQRDYSPTPRLTIKWGHFSISVRKTYFILFNGR